METLRFLTPKLARNIATDFATPTYVYDLKSLRQQATAALAFPNAYGLTVRFAMKASPSATILRAFEKMGLHIDASSGYEVQRAINAGIAPDKISLSTQEFPQNFDTLHAQGIHFNACSLHQLEAFGKTHQGEKLGIRFNPGQGSGGTSKTNVGGPASSFGIWHEDIDKVKALVNQYDLKVIRIHTHIGSGSDPEVWQRTSALSFNLVRAFPDVTILNLGGGYKVGRMASEVSTDLKIIGAPVKKGFEQLYAETGRKVHLEIEPGTFLVANTCALLTSVQDMTATGSEGYHFLKLDCGMTDILRPSLYGAQHPLIIVPQEPTKETQDYVVVGHCCESGDLLTPAPDEPEDLAPRTLHKASIGDLCIIEGAGAYCSSMSTAGYNAFPQAPEVLIDEDGMTHLIRTRQSLDQLTQNEKTLEF